MRFASLFRRSLFATVVLMAASPAGATTREVPSDFATIQAAVDASASEDTVIVHPGTYVESLSLSGKDLGYSASGGAIHVDLDASLSARACLFDSNFVQGFEGGPGGAIATSGATTLDSCRFVSNFGSSGSIAASGSLVVEDCVFHENNAIYEASAVDWRGVSQDATLELRRSVFLGNTSEVAVIQVFGQGEIDHCTIVGNGKGVLVSGEITLTNNIVAENQSVGIETYYGNEGTIECNDVWSNSGGNYGPEIGNQTGINRNLSVDPLFCPYDDGNPLGRNLHLTPQSPCAPGPGVTNCGLRGALPVYCPGPASTPGAPIRVASLLPISPNPSAGPFRFHLEVSRAARIRITVIDVSGRARGDVAAEHFEPGRYVLPWNEALEPGLYWVRLEGAGLRESRRFVIMR